MNRTLLTILLGLFLVSVVGFTGYAEGRKYHDEALYGLKGSVSEVSTKSKSKLPGKKSTAFNKNGRERVSLSSYDADGYATGYNLAFGDSEMKYEVEWNENLTPKSISFNSIFGPVEGTGKIEYFYDDDQTLPVKAVAESGNRKGTKKKTVVCEYSDYVLDDHGNWISRNVTETVTEKGKEKTTSFQETRKITY